MTDETSLKNVIARCHVELDRLFFAHQEAVLVGEMSRALDELHRYSVAHDLHKRFEDTHLISRLAELDDPGSWPVTLYEREHDKIEAQLAKLRDTLNGLVEQNIGGTALRIEIIALLDREKSYKGLCEHHQEREEAGMLPALDEQTDAAWRTEIIAPFSAEWQATIELLR